jgi:hypothetical protein
MKVKIGDKIYNSHNEPICIQVSVQESACIGGVYAYEQSRGKFLSCPEESFKSDDEAKAWMHFGKDL